MVRAVPTKLQADLHMPSALWATIGIPCEGADLFSSLERGLSLFVYAELARSVGLSEADLAAALEIEAATLERRIEAGRFNEDESYKLYRLALIFTAACTLCEGNTKAAQRWLTRAAAPLGNRRPVEMAATGAQTGRVIDLIARQHYDVNA